MREGWHPRALRSTALAEGTVLSGPVAEILAAGDGASTKEPRVLLLHVGDPDAPPVDDARTLLVAGFRAPVSVGRDATGIGVAVPLASVTAHVLAPVTVLDDTTLVRASRALLTSVIDDLGDGQAAHADTIDDALLAIVRGIIHEHPRATSPDSRDASLGVRLESLIDARHTDARVDVAQLARELHASRRQLYRHAPDGGVAALLAQRRIATARELLTARPDLTVGDVAIRAGFSSASRLRAQFLRSEGVTPTEYRRRGERPDPPEG